MFYILSLNSKIMKLGDLLLKKEELPILHGHCFQVPIHPRLLEYDILIDENLSREAFKKTVPEWYDDLKVYTDTEQINIEDRCWYNGVFLKAKPKVISSSIYNNTLKLSTVSWEDKVDYLDNELARVFSISRNSGGSLYFGKNDFNCEIPVSKEGLLRYFKFSREKIKEFDFEKEESSKFGRFHVYAHHNIDYFPGALFLRNWAINYMNM